MLKPVELLGLDNGLEATFFAESSVISTIFLVEGSAIWVFSSVFAIGFTICFSSRKGARIINFFF